MAQVYSAVPIGNLGGGDEWTVSRSLSQSGYVTGKSRDALGVDRAFLWSAGTPMIDLGNIGGEAEGMAVNNAGVVVAYGALADGTGDHFIYNAGTITRLGLTGSYEAWGIDDSGDILVRNGMYSFIRDAATGNLLPIPAFGTQTKFRASMMTTSGLVVGKARDATGLKWCASIYSRAGGLVSLVESSDANATGISTDGHYVVGTKSASGATSSWIWDGVDFTYFTAPEGYFGTPFPFSVNNNGEVVGQLNGSKAFVWDAERGFRFLGDLMPMEGLYADDAQLINDAGQITVRYQPLYDGYVDPTYLFTPVPEPITLSLLGVGIGAIAFGKRR